MARDQAPLPRPRMIRPSRSTFWLAALFVLPPACQRGSAEGEQARLSGAKPRESARVVVAPVERREMVRRLETTTRIESQTQVAIYPRSAGVVVELLAEEGDGVAKDQELARLDDRDKRLSEADARVALEEAKANLPKLEFATREAESRRENMRLAYEQAVRDHERNLAIAQGEGGVALLSKKDLDASQLARDKSRGEHENAKLFWERARIEAQAGITAVSRAELALERATLELSHMQIRSPIAGVVAERSIRVGDTVGGSTSAFVVTDPLALRTVFYRPQRELGLFQTAPRPGGAGDGGSPEHAAGARIGADLELVVRAEALPGRTFRGVIERVSPTIDPASGNFRVTARLDPLAREDSIARLLPGMLVRLEIVTERHPDALVVPKRAIRREGERTLVFVVQDGIARSVDVAEGFGDDQDVEVVASGERKLAPGEAVVVVGNRDLEDGAQVSTADASPVAPGAQEEPGVAEAVAGGD